MWKLPKGSLVISAAVLLSSNFAHSQDNKWDGVYLNAKTGAVFSQFNTNTFLPSSVNLSSVQVGAINKAGNRQITENGFLAGIEVGYDWRFNHLLLGLGLDLTVLNVNGENNTNALGFPDSSGQFTLINYASQNGLLDIRPRIGRVFTDWMIYATGGVSLGWIQSNTVLSVPQVGVSTTQERHVKSGYVAGLGLEKKISEELSIQSEYLYHKFGNIPQHVTGNIFPKPQPISSGMSTKTQQVTLGLTYRPYEFLNSKYSKVDNLAFKDWIIEVGTRLFLSSGKDGAPNPLLNSSPIGNQLASRLIFSQLSAISGEVFARVDIPNGFFVKGMLGAGSVIHGKLNDEDFPGEFVYSNTLSSVKGNLAYASADLGLTLISNASSKLGAFVGYQYNSQSLNAYGCRQLAGAVICLPTAQYLNILGITQDDTYNALRLGLNVIVDLTHRLSLDSEVAYLPLLRLRGTDIHDLRALLGPEASNHGDGASIETIFNYQFNPTWAIGLGARYWMFNTHNGQVLFDFLGDPEIISEPARFKTDRYGIFVQVKYHPDSGAAERNKDEIRPEWSGLYFGGFLGGAFGRIFVSDPFPSTSSFGRTNLRGFGNVIEQTGPIGGFDINFNKTYRQLVLGLEASVARMDLRGEQTLFSGVGGINDQVISDYLITFSGRAGKEIGRSLIYLKAGGAHLHATHRLNGNTGLLMLGKENIGENRYGYLGGVGVEYAFNSQWSSNIEYDYIYLPNKTLSVNRMPIISAENISARMNLNRFLVSVRYKFLK